MADRVRFIMDRLASTLMKVQAVGIFTSDEVKSIIKKRTDFEYVLMRRELSEADFSKYLDYEIKLNKLR